MIVVIDVSAAAEIVLQRPRASVLSEKLEQADEAIAPTLFISEACNTFWKYYRAGKMPMNTCQKAIERTLGLVDAYVSDRELHQEAFAMACSTGLPAYDMFYLVLARRSSALLLTLDDDLRPSQATKAKGPVRLMRRGPFLIH